MNPDELKSLSLDIPTLSAAFSQRVVSVSAVVREVYRRIAQQGEKPDWIHVIPEKLSLERAVVAEAALKQGLHTKFPLLGIPFAIKDNIDCAGTPTTAGCPQFSYAPAQSAFAVQNLLDAGAIPIGKTNLDQFATGLVGTRSPYGACRNVFDPDYISGGSSSGSAVVVAREQVSFALGTDTAGSGRIPAAFNNLVGFKPTRGLVSTRGVVPACRSLDCVSVFAHTCPEAWKVLQILKGFDVESVYSRRDRPVLQPRSGPFRFGVPGCDGLCFFGNSEYAQLFDSAIQNLRRAGGTPVEIDFTPFREAARLLYEGPWLAERYTAVREFIERQPDALFPLTLQILSTGRGLTAADAFDAFHRLEECRRAAEVQWERMNVLLTPTAGTIFMLDEVEREPTLTNSNLGYYTNYVNLLDCCAIALPSGFDSRGLPFGISLIARAFEDSLLNEVGSQFEGVGKRDPKAPNVVLPAVSEAVKLAVVGAHLSGQPLNFQLTQLNARLLESTCTAPCYRLYALAGTIPPKPGLVRVKQGSEIEVEVWELGVEQFGRFVAAVPSPLTIGTVLLKSGESVKGFLAEQESINGARDISEFRGWRRFLTEHLKERVGILA